MNPTPVIYPVPRLQGLRSSKIAVLLTLWLFLTFCMVILEGQDYVTRQCMLLLASLWFARHPHTLEVYSKSVRGEKTKESTVKVRK